MSEVFELLVSADSDLSAAYISRFLRIRRERAYSALVALEALGLACVVVHRGTTRKTWKATPA